LVLSNRAIEDDPYPLSPRAGTRKAILVKIGPSPHAAASN
jgi:hypothetical protein